MQRTHSINSITHDRYGYQGSAMDDEVKGNGNSYTTEFRQYDPRIGRWLSLDPLTAQFPWQSPYCAFDNNPILYNDPLGLAAKGGPPSTMPKDSKIGDKSKDGLWEVEDVGDGVLNWVKYGGEIEEIVVKPNKKSESNSNFQQTLEMFDSYRTSLFFSELDKRQKEWEAHNPFKFGNSWESYVNEDKLIRPWNYSPQSIQACDWFWQLFIGPITSSATTSTTLSESIAFTTENVVAKTSTNVLSKGELLRIENAATRINKPITVVGSRAKGTAGVFSDWDYVIPGLNSKNWSTIKNSLPGARSVLDNTPRNIDIFKGPVNSNLPHITIYPR